MSQKPIVRLHLYFATENDRAVILRQGPTRQFRLILWHRDSDTFEDGQWLKQKVYADRCDLSPDGRHFIYFALNGDWSGESEGAYSALSRPPWFTALALFPEGSTWGGGGRFFDNRHYWAVGGEDVIGRAEGLVRLIRRKPGADCPSGLVGPDGKCARIGNAKVARGTATEQESRTHVRDRYDTSGGVLSRWRGGKLEPIRDFNGMEFEPVRAPYDWRDEDGEADHRSWYPLDGEGSP